jgi:hypothetical protein
MRSFLATQKKILFLPLFEIAGQTTVLSVLVGRGARHAGGQLGSPCG